MRLGFLGRAHLSNAPQKLSPCGFSLLDRWCLSCLLEGGLLEGVVEVGWELMPAWSWDSLSSTIIMIRALTEDLLNAKHCPKPFTQITPI